MLHKDCPKRDMSVLSGSPVDKPDKKMEKDIDIHFAADRKYIRGTLLIVARLMKELDIETNEAERERLHMMISWAMNGTFKAKKE